MAQRTPMCKALVGPPSLWLLRTACQRQPRLSALVAPQCNAPPWVGRLPSRDASSSITLPPKGSRTQASPADPRCMVVGALPTKLYASALERKVSDHAEAAERHAERQFGFRRGHSREEAIFALRMVMESYRQLRRPAASCVDCKQACNSVPRQQLGAPQEH